jgi:hypothetical protein
MSNATHSSTQFDLRFGWVEEIDAFDKLPKPIREKIMYAKFSISSKMALNLYKMLQNENQVLKAIEQIEEQMEKGVI